MSRITSRLILLTSVGGKESLRTDESERDDEKRKWKATRCLGSASLLK